MDDVLVVGESLVDIVATLSGAPHEYAGGSAANVAVALSRLGRPVRLATSYADDAHGQMVSAHLAGAGVTLACDPYAVEHTSTAMATIGTAGAARYTFDIDWRLSTRARGARARWSRTPARSVPCSRPVPPTSSSCSGGCASGPRSPTTSTPALRSPAPAPRSWTPWSG